MKTVTYEEFLKFEPCWLGEEGGAERIKSYFDRFGGSMSALDILNLNDVSKADKLWSVLREELIPAPILHEFACVCAEYALSFIETPDPRSIKAIKVKRAWIRGEATDRELDAARAAAWNAFEATKDATTYAAWDAANRYARLATAARYAAWDAAAKYAAKGLAGDAATRYAAAMCTAGDTTREAQVAYLIMTLEEEEVRGNG